MNESNQQDATDEDIWCICRQPEGGRFMICCDKCDVWYHGSCVGLSRSKGRELEKRRLDYICPFCKNKDREDRIKKGREILFGATETKLKSPIKPTESLTKFVKEAPPDIKTEKTEVPIVKKPERRLASKTVTRNDHLDNNNYIKKSLTDAIKAENSKIEVVTDPPTSKSYSITSQSSPDSITDTAKLSSKRRKGSPEEVVVKKLKVEENVSSKECLAPGCTKAAQSGTVYCSKSCIRYYARQFVEEDHSTTCVQSPTISSSSKGEKSPGDTTTNISVIDKSSGTLLAGVSAPSSSNLSDWLIAHPSFQVLSTAHNDSNDSQSVGDIDPYRDSVRRSFWEELTSAASTMDDVPSTFHARRLSEQIEVELMRIHNRVSASYKEQSRNLLYNLRDRRNDFLRIRLVKGTLRPHKLVRMKPGDMRLMSNLAVATPTVEDSFACVTKDTTSRHGDHVFDVNCRICSSGNPTPKPKLKEGNIRRMSPTRRPFNSPTPVHLLPLSTALSVPRTPSVWKGFVKMGDSFKFVTVGFPVNGKKVSLPDTLDVCGRIDPSSVWSYMSRVKKTHCRDITVMRFNPVTDDEKTQYIKFYQYLDARKRCGVCTSSKHIKDMYILPLATHEQIPSVLLPFDDGPGLDDPRPNLLLCVIISHNLPPSTDKISESSHSERKHVPEPSKKPEKSKSSAQPVKKKVEEEVMEPATVKEILSRLVSNTVNFNQNPSTKQSEHKQKPHDCGTVLKHSTHPGPPVEHKFSSSIKSVSPSQDKFKSFSHNLNSSADNVKISSAKTSTPLPTTTSSTSTTPLTSPASNNIASTEIFSTILKTLMSVSSVDPKLKKQQELLLQISKQVDERKTELDSPFSSSTISPQGRGQESCSKSSEISTIEPNTVTESDTSETSIPVHEIVFSDEEA